jgi:hypothetical protein
MSNYKMEENRRHKAQGMVEFALILPIFLVLILGIFEMGRLLYIFTAAYTSAREAARYGAAAGKNPENNEFYYKDCEGIKGAAKKIVLLTPLADEQIDIRYDSGPTTAPAWNNRLTCPYDAQSGDRISVRVQVNYQPLQWFLPLNPITIYSTSSRTLLKEIQVSVIPSLRKENEVVTITRPTKENYPNQGCSVIDSHILV